MPKLDGLEVVNSSKKTDLSTAVVLLTMYKEDRFFNAALDAGVSGYVLKTARSRKSLRRFAPPRAEKILSARRFRRLLVKRLNRAENPSNNPLDSLTASERRVLKLVAETKNNKQIAEELFISIRTVENHRSNICAKLDLEGKNALLTYALTNKAEI